MNLAERARRGWNSFFFTGFSVESLGLLRLYFGFGLLFFHVTQFFTFFEQDPLRPGFVYFERVWYISALGLERDLPGLHWLLFALLMAATFTMAVGKWTRPSIATVLVLLTYLQGVRDSIAGDTHHRYLIPAQILLLLLLSPCDRAHAWDARGRALEPVPEWRASWPIKAMQVYTASFYFWSLLAKLRVSGAAWFGGQGALQELLLRRSAMWGIDHQGEPLGNSAAFWLAGQPELLTVLSLGVFVLEGGFPLILAIRSVRVRLVFLLGATVFHVVNFVLLYVFFLALPIAFLIFFDLVPVHAWLRARFARRGSA